MTHLLYRLTLLFTFLVGISGCNGDVFVKPLEASVSEIALDSETSEASVTFNKSDWNFDLIYNGDESTSGNFCYYDEEGNEKRYFEVNDSNRNQFTLKYIYSSPQVEFEIVRRPYGKSLDIHCIRYQEYYPLVIQIEAYDDYTKSIINVTLKYCDELF